MPNAAEGVDVLLVVPFEPASAALMDNKARMTQGVGLALPLALATHELESFVGRELDFWDPKNRPTFDGERMPFPVHRSTTAVTLATYLDAAGVTWQVVDPGVQELVYWRGVLAKARSRYPRVVAISTTFIVSAPWLKALVGLVRQELPRAKLVIGGYYYATNARQFLSLDADVFCVGEGELRLPDVICALRDGKPLERISGLFVRKDDGSLLRTGVAEPLDLSSLKGTDWSLAERIEPPIRLDTDDIEFTVETQRGCVFKCEYCTYRTLASPEALMPEEAVEAILATRISPRGYINMADSTATFPHERWEEIMRILASRGGSPHPIWAFARVSDINDERAALMARAGVRQLFVGQESGDQRMLNLMKKGTQVSLVKPAVAALARYGIRATFGFIHGFPGEDEHSLRASRALILGLNDGFEQDPVVPIYTVYPFLYMDFAQVTQRTDVQGSDHYLGYTGAGMSPKQALDAVLTTMIQVSRVPHAPAFAFLFEAAPATSGIVIVSRPYRRQVFRWLKAVERGVAIFLERDVEGRRPNLAELRAVREAIIANYPVAQHAAAVQARSRVKQVLMRRLAREWSREQKQGPGPLTRALLAGMAFKDAGRLAPALRALRTAEYGLGERAGQDVVVQELARDLVQVALERGNKPSQRWRERNRRVRDEHVGSKEPTQCSESDGPLQSAAFGATTR